MKSEDENVLGKGIEAIFERTARPDAENTKTIELPNGVIIREGDELTIRLQLDKDDNIRGAVEVLTEMSLNGMLDSLQDPNKIRSRIVDHLEMAQMAMEDGDHQSAIDELQNCLKISDIPTVRYNLALMQELSGNLDKAVRNYKRVIKTSPRDIQALNNLGKIYYRKGDFTRAMTIYEKAVKLKPNIGKGTKNGFFGKRFGFRTLAD